MDHTEKPSLNKETIVELSLVNKSQQWKDITWSRSKLNKVWHRYDQ